MPSLDPMAIEWLASGVPVIILGSSIKSAGWSWLLAGYSESTATILDDVNTGGGG